MLWINETIQMCDWPFTHFDSTAPDSEAGALPQAVQPGIPLIDPESCGAGSGGQGLLGAVDCRQVWQATRLGRSRLGARLGGNAVLVAGGRGESWAGHEDVEDRRVSRDSAGDLEPVTRDCAHAYLGRLGLAGKATTTTLKAADVEPTTSEGRGHWQRQQQEKTKQTDR